MMQEEGEKIGRFKVRSLMRELALVSKQPGSHAYKKATVERPDIPNILNRAFDAEAPNQVWCGDITYVWAQGKGTIWQLSWISMHAESWAGPYQKNRTQTSWSKRWTWLTNNAVSLKGYCSIPTRGRNMAAVNSARDCGAIACARA